MFLAYFASVHPRECIPVLIERCASLCWVLHWNMRVVAGTLPCGAGHNVVICVVGGSSERFLDECRGSCVMGGK